MTIPPKPELDEDAPVFSIAIAAELAQMHPQTLRQYDRMGLVVPERTSGRVRRYSLVDIAKLREISELSEAGVSLEGILRIIELRQEVRTLRKRMQELEHELAEERLERQRVFAAGHGEIIAISRGRRLRARNEIVLWDPRAAARHPQRPDSEGSGFSAAEFEQEEFEQEEFEAEVFEQDVFEADEFEADEVEPDEPGRDEEEPDYR